MSSQFPYLKHLDSPTPATARTVEQRAASNGGEELEMIGRTLDDVALSFMGDMVLAPKGRPKSTPDTSDTYKSNEGGLGFMPEFDGLASSTAPGTYEPKYLNARHREIIRLAILGYKHVQIGAMLSISPVTVGYVINSPLGQAFMAEIQEARTDSVKDVGERLKEMSPFAAEVILDIMANGSKEENKLRAAEKVLEITGHRASEKHLHLHTQMSVDDIRKVKDEVRRAKGLEEGSVDVVGVEVME